MAQPTKTSSRLPEALIVAAAPPVAYLFSFAFEAGYAHVFGIPMELVSITLTSLFLAAGSFLLIGLFLLVLADLASMLLPDPLGPVGRAIVVLGPMALATLAYCFYALGTPLAPSLRGIAVGWLVILLLQFAWPLLTQRDKASYAEKLASQAKLEGTGILGRAARRFPAPYLLVYSLGLALYITYYAGQSSAYRQQDFLVSQTTPQRVILRVYGDRVISAPFDPVAHFVIPQFTIMRLDEPTVPELVLLPIGPLVRQPQGAPTSSAPLSPTPSSAVPTAQPALSTWTP